MMYIFGTAIVLGLALCFIEEVRKHNVEDEEV
jgi:hypothetical protein